MIKNPSASVNIPDGSILNIKLADATISSAKLDASLNALISAGGGGGLTENSVSSFHIISGSILTTDICNNAITYDKLAVDAVTNTRIANGAVTHAKLSSDCVQSHNIVDGTILGTDISGYTIQGSNIAEGTITSFNIANGTILNTDISGGTIKGSNISEGTITSYNILNGTILGTDICGNTIGAENLDQQLKDRLKKLENPTGLITIVSSGVSTTWFMVEALYKDDLGGFNSFYNNVNKIGAGMTHHFIYTSDKFLYGANPVLRIKITNATPTGYYIHQGATLVSATAVTGAYHIDVENVFGSVKNMVLEIEV